MRRALRCLLALALVAGPVVAAPATPALAAPTTPAPAQVQALSVRQPVMLVVDTSGSMADDDGTGVAKIDGARAALLDVLNVLPVDGDVGLRTYPAGDGSCDSGTLAVPPGQRDPKSMAAQVNALHAGGDTPTAEALQAAGDDLKAAGYTSATLVLVSDGLSTCADPCPVAAKLAASGLNVTVNTVGFRIDDKGADQLRCIANATNGSYTDVTNSDALAQTLAVLNGAKLDVTVKSPAQYSPAVAASLNVSVAVHNVSAVDAPDVRASIVFDPGASGGSPTVLRPVRLLGNVAGGATATAEWDVFPSTVTNRGELDFTVTITRGGGAPPEVRTGKVQLSGALNVAAGGDLVKNAHHVVVLGDSYSAGEGGMVQAPAGHSYTEGGCHRSDQTYAMQLFAHSSAQVTNLACSGAVVNDYWTPQSGRNVPSQHDQLMSQHDIDLMFLTDGGNDMNFSAIIKNCLLGSDCTADVLSCGYEMVSEKSLCGYAVKADPLLWQKQLADLRPQLVNYYKHVLDDTKGRGTTSRGAPPLVVLPYTNVLPGSGLAISCAKGFPLLSQDEKALVLWLEDALNSEIAQAVAEVRASNSRIYYADDVVHALEPDHTLCGNQRWVNGLLDGKSEQEKIHPNSLGYGSEAAALLRWSRTVTDPKPGDVRDSRPLYYRIGDPLVQKADQGFTWLAHGAENLWHSASQIDLQAPGVLPIVPGIRYDTTGGGFAAGETVVVSVASTPQALATAVADKSGRIHATVQVPADLPPGSHTLFATGFTPAGKVQLIGRRVTVSRPSVAGALTVGAGAVLLLVGGVLLIRLAVRRRRAGIALRRGQAEPGGPQPV